MHVDRLSAALTIVVSVSFLIVMELDYNNIIYFILT